MGAEVREPSLTEKALEYNFTNEGGVFGTWRYLKTSWACGTCRNASAPGHTRAMTCPMMRSRAWHLKQEPFLAVIDPDDNRFLHPGDMPERIRKYCQDTNQAVPETKGEIIRVALESLALKYRWVLEKLEELAGKEFSPIHIIGGGTRNRLLNQFTANATDRVVVTGPVEATAIGNVLMQAIGLGHLASLSEARAVVRASFEVEEYQPARQDDWDEAYSRLLKLLNDKS